MTCIGCAHPARPFVAVQREDIGVERRVEKGSVEPVAQFIRPRPVAGRPHRIAGRFEQAGRCLPGAIDIGLHFGERDRPARDAAIGMEDAVMAVLPALILQALIGQPAIFDKAVAIPVAMLVDPGERSLDLRHDAVQKADVAGAVEIGPGQHDEKRRGIDAAIIMAEGHLAQLGHFAAANLVQDLAWLRIGGGIEAGGLMRGEIAQHAAR